MVNENMNKNKKFILILVLAFLVIFAVWLVYWIFVRNYEFLKFVNSGVFGDSFGALNALFSGWAFAGIIITIFMQREELKLQRNELSLQRVETKRLADAQEASKEALRKTARLSALSALLEYNNNKVSRLLYVSDKFENRSGSTAEKIRTTYPTKIENIEEESNQYIEEIEEILNEAKELE